VLRRAGERGCSRRAATWKWASAGSRGVPTVWSNRPTLIRRSGGYENSVTELRRTQHGWMSKGWFTPETLAHRDIAWTTRVLLIA